MGVFECIQYLRDDLDRIANAYLAVGREMIEQRFALGEFHHDDGHALVIDQIINRHDVRMIEPT